MRPWQRNAAIAAGGLLLIAIVAFYFSTVGSPQAQTTSAPEEFSPLSKEQRMAVARALVAHEMPLMDELKVDLATGFIVATFTLNDTYRARLKISLQEFGETGLIAIRSVLKSAGYRNYRVNVNGPPPGVGLVTRLGSARSVENSPIEWLTP